jgi:hypothetical protein
LRHSAAVAWLESGVHIKAVADLLGHSSVAITRDIDGDTSDDTAGTAVKGLAGRLGLWDCKNIRQAITLVGLTGLDTCEHFTQQGTGQCEPVFEYVQGSAVCMSGQKNG